MGVADEDHYGRYVRELNSELKKPDSSIIKKLLDTDSDFKNCKQFESRVDFTGCARHSMRTGSSGR